MPWVKIPPSHHSVFRAALPRDPRIETVQMFGGIAAKVNGHMFAALFGRSAMVVLGDADRAAALGLDGAEPFDPMERGRVDGNKVLLPEEVFHDRDELRRWLDRALAYVATLSPKRKAAPRGPARRPVASARAARPRATERATPSTPAAGTAKRRRSRG